MVRSKMSLFPRSAWLAVAGVAFAAASFNASQASASVLIDSNFNTSATGNSGSLSGAWTITGSDANTYVTNTGAESAFTSTPGGHSDLIYDNSTASNVALVSPHIGTNQSLQLSFDFYVNATSGENDAVIVGAKTGYYPVMTLLFSSGYPSHDVYWSNGSSLTNINSSSQSFAPVTGSWYHVTMSAQALTLASPTWAFDITNTSGLSLLSASGLAFQNSVAGLSYNNISFGSDNGASTVGNNYLLDNVVAQSPVPEPASLLALAAAGAGILLLPRSKRGQ